MTPDDLHRAWAPSASPWSKWVKPVLFAHMKPSVEPAALAAFPAAVVERIVDALRGGGERSAPAYRTDVRLNDVTLVVDLPGEEGVTAGMAFAAHGFRPIPLYNALPARASVVDVNPIIDALVDGASALAPIERLAPPAFLLDANRMTGGRRLRPGAFDNRSVCEESDFPSAQTLSDAGIRRAVFVQRDGDRPQADLGAVLIEWQRRGIELWCAQVDSDVTAAPLRLRPLGWLDRFLFALDRMALRRREDATFGEFVSQGG